jgi:SAM-dependent methyltransferase
VAEDVTTTVAYKPWRDAWFEFDGLLDWLTAQESVRSVCEVGAGATPVFSAEVIAARGLDHFILDVSEEELDKAPGEYRKVKADIAAPDFVSPDPVDLVATGFVAEHIPDPGALHANILRMLRPGGVALHLFPTLYALPFVLNRALPERLTDAVLVRLQPFRRPESHDAKFKAYYRWCRGPTQRQLARLEAIGYEVLAYTGYFGHGYYLHNKPLHRIEHAKAEVLMRYPVPYLTSYGLTLLRRPDSRSAPFPDIPARPRSNTVVSPNTVRHIEAGWR